MNQAILLGFDIRILMISNNLIESKKQIIKKLPFLTLRNYQVSVFDAFFNKNIHFFEISKTSYLKTTFH